MSEDQILAWFAQYAYQPIFVYSAVIALMVASSFGLPVPEEITLFSAGIVCYMSSRPDLYPPPFEGAPTVDVTFMAILCFFAVFLSDLLVFSLGRFFGGRLLKTRLMKNYEKPLEKVSQWTQKYGPYAAGIFRFTPGLRFPGHFSCGAMGLPYWKFCAVDGFAALFSVPTQVLLFAHFGEQILGAVRQFKIALLAVVICGVGVWALRRYLGRRERTSSIESS